MKLLVCVACSDIVALRTWLKSCRCGKSCGKYLKNKRTAEISGPCVVMGAPNEHLFWIVEPYKFIKRRRMELNAKTDTAGPEPGTAPEK